LRQKDGEGMHSSQPQLMAIDCTTIQRKPALTSLEKAQNSINTDTRFSFSYAKVKKQESKDKRVHDTISTRE
jgi:hypothetical protein